jgi:hypothetical protein
MKIVKKSMRLWITFASVFSFLTGWALLSHANKPAPLIASQPAAVSSPASNQSVQSLNRNTSSGGFLLPQQNLSNFSRPRLRTGGS